MAKPLTDEQRNLLAVVVADPQAVRWERAPTGIQYYDLTAPRDRRGGAALVTNVVNALISGNLVEPVPPGAVYDGAPLPVDGRGVPAGYVRVSDMGRKVLGLPPARAGELLRRWARPATPEEEATAVRGYLREGGPGRLVAWAVWVPCPTCQRWHEHPMAESEPVPTAGAVVFHSPHCIGQPAAALPSGWVRIQSAPFRPEWTTQTWTFTAAWHDHATSSTV